MLQIFFNFLAILPPLCVPGCGVNAHCTYGVPNQCQCNPGFTGNPYSVCGKY